MPVPAASALQNHWPELLFERKKWCLTFTLISLSVCVYVRNTVIFDRILPNPYGIIINVISATAVEFYGRFIEGKPKISQKHTSPMSYYFILIEIRIIIIITSIFHCAFYIGKVRIIFEFFRTGFALRLELGIRYSSEYSRCSFRESMSLIIKNLLSKVDNDINNIFCYVVAINHGTEVLFQSLATSTWKWPIIHVSNCCKKKQKQNAAKTYSRAARERNKEIFKLQVLIWYTNVRKNAVYDVSDQLTSKTGEKKKKLYIHTYILCLIKAAFYARL